MTVKVARRWAVPYGLGMTPEPALRRTIGLSMLVLYGLGTTIGGGIYVLIGQIAARAGMLAPLSFAVAAILVAFTALSYAELGSRYPKSGGEAMYVKHGFGRRDLAVAVGSMAILCGLVSSATLAHGFAGYVQNFAPDIPSWVAIVAIVVAIGVLAAWGIGESVAAASIVTVIEIGGLVLVIWAGGPALAEMPDRIGELMPLSWNAWTGLLSASFLAFFAFIGFGDMVNVAEEVKDAERAVPRAVIVTLIATLILYVLVALVAVFAVPIDRLAGSDAPLIVIAETRAPWAGRALGVIGIFAVLNGILIQIIMAARIVHGMAREGWVPARLGRVHARTQTPVRATVLAVATILILALVFPIGILAEITSLMVLIVASVVNGALLRLKFKPAYRRGAAAGTLRLPIYVPAVGLVVSTIFSLLIVANLLS